MFHCCLDCRRVVRIATLNGVTCRVPFAEWPPKQQVSLGFWRVWEFWENTNWLVVWNMNFIFPNQIGDDDPIWRTHIFQGGRYNYHQPAKKLPQFIMMALRIGDIAPVSHHVPTVFFRRSWSGQQRSRQRWNGGHPGNDGKTPEMADPKHDNEMCIVNIVVEL